MWARPRRAAAAAIGACAVALIGCGSSGQLSRRELGAKANAICATAQRAARAVPAPTNLNDPAAAAAYFDKLAPLTDKETRDLAALRPDEQVKRDWSAFISAQKAANAVVQTLKSKSDAKLALGATDLAGIVAAGNREPAAAVKVDANTCAQ